VPEISNETLVKGAALVAQMYLTAALDEAERKALFEVKQVFARMRATFLADLKADPPFAMFLQAEQMYRDQTSSEETPR